uniref:Zgc:193801 n=1 Tax=Cyprinus carpio TaxID=7962 RepID=A0A8C1MJP0_CYPCA
LGTEHTYIPVLCQDEKCSGQEKGVHMHCPLCSVAEAYQDPVILRAHFRIKHVDKGIDFAGLKVLRCCIHCEIVGTIKGEKRFKGAHWHCYRCRNGFNRRDEAIKHYKTHFRNPHTTFQIQVTQNVNCRQYYGESSEAHAKAYEGLAVSLGPGGDGTSIGSIITQPFLTTGTETLLTVEPKEDGERNGIPLGAEEEVGSSQNSSDGTQTFVLMDPDGQGNSVIYDTATGIITEQEAEGWEQALLQKRLLELHQQIDTVRQEKESMEKTLRAEIKQLKEQMENLEAQHKELLQAQLASLRREILSGTDNMPIDGHKGALELSVDSEEPQTEAISGTLPGLEDMDVQHEELKSTDLELVPNNKIPCLESPGLGLELPNSGLTTSKVLEDKQEVSLSLVSSKKRSSADDSEEMTPSKVQRFS